MDANVEEIARALRLYHPDPNAVFEIRALKVDRGGTAVGYFSHDQIPKAAAAAARLSGNSKGVYVTLNPVDPQLKARADGRIKRYATETTQDKEIVRLRQLLIDVDPVRPAGICATAQEKACAVAVAAQIQAELFPGIEPIAVDSGNGAQLLYAINLPNDSEVKSCYSGC